MKTFKLIDKDLVLDAQNNIVLVEGRDEEEQTIKILFETNTGEWFLNILHGLRLEHFQGKGFNEERARAELLLALEQEERVKELEKVDFIFDRASRKLLVDFKIKMVSDNIIEGQEVIGL